MNKLFLLILVFFCSCAVGAERLEALYRQKSDTYETQIKQKPADEKLKQKDVKRMNQIVDLLKCSFYRYDEKRNRFYQTNQLSS